VHSVWTYCYTESCCNKKEAAEAEEEAAEDHWDLWNPPNLQYGPHPTSWEWTTLTRRAGELLRPLDVCLEVCLWLICQVDWPLYNLVCLVVVRSSSRVG
jgi:hypothetical protein